MNLNIFLNEKSLHSQFDSQTIKEAFDELFGCLNIISSCKGVDIKYYYRPHELYNSILTTDKRTLDFYLKQNKELSKNFHLKTKSFQPIGNLSNDTYLYGGIKYINSSVGDSYECDDSLLLNWKLSVFGEPTIDVTKDKISKYIDSFFSQAELRKHFEKGQVLKPEYNSNSSRAPRDEETILKDSSLFTPTNYTVQGRVVYERIGHNEYWYVDNSHAGESAHLEVFSTTSRHQIHVSKIDDVVYYRELSKKERKRTISFD